MDPNEKLFQSLQNNSFVIIEEMSAENQKQIKLTDNLLKNSVLDVIIDKFNSDSIVKNQPLAEEIEKTVYELLKENAKLKETLQQNNATMKQQLTTLTKLQEEVCKIHLSHKQKFEETKELVLKLRAENQELKKPLVHELICSMGCNKNNEAKQMTTDHQNIELSNVSLILFEVPSEKQQSLREKNSVPQQKLCSDDKCASFKSEISTENRFLKQRLAVVQHKLCEVKQHLAVNSRTDKEHELIQVISDLTKQLENAERAKRKLALDVDRLSAQELKLQRLLSSGESKNVTDYCYWTAIFPAAVISAPFEVQLIENLKRFEELLNSSENLENELPDNEESTLSSWVNLHTSQDDQTFQFVKPDVTVFYKLLSQEQGISNVRKDIIANARIKFKEIYKQCLAILKEHDTKMKAQEIESVKLKEKLKEEENLRHELSDKQNRVTQMEAELTFLGNVLKKKMQESERKTEDLSLLQSQIKIYEEDFISEREARESLANEKEVLERKLNDLLLHNKELLKELNESHDEGSNTNSNQSYKEAVNEKRYTCFNNTCNESFPSEDELQQHVYSCLNIKD